MSRIQEAFKGKKVFIPFVTCGDPDLETTKQIVDEMEKAGVALIELGIPFSDPTAEGPVIQGANLRALTGGVTTDKIFDMVKEIRQNTQIPLVFMTYANVVFSYGTERFLEKAKNVEMDGLILPDVPFEEKEEFDIVCKKYGIDLISLIAPTSHDRIRMIAKEASGFVYCVSSLGVTGTRSAITIVHLWSDSEAPRRSRERRCVRAQTVRSLEVQSLSCVRNTEKTVCRMLQNM